MECFEAIVGSFQWLTNAVKVSVLGVCMSPGYSCVVFCTVAIYLISHFSISCFFCRLWLVIVIIASLNFVAIAFSSIFLYWYCHSCNNEKSKFVRTLFVNLITVAVFYCRYVIDKDIVASFYKQSIFLVEYSVSVCVFLPISLCVSLSFSLQVCLSMCDLFATTRH